MRLIDLEPRWFGPNRADGVEVRTGLTFRCPCGRSRVPVPFRNALVVQPPDHPWPTAEGWQREGDTFDAMTLAPSIAAKCGCHFNVRAGVLLIDAVG